MLFRSRLPNVKARDSPDVKSYPALQLAQATQTFVIPPASKVGYQDWYGYRVASTNAIRNELLALHGAMMPMCCLIVEFGPSHETNYYDVCLACNDNCRWPADTLYASLAKPAPTISQEVFDKKNALALRHGGTAVSLDAPATGSASPAAIPV